MRSSHAAILMIAACSCAPAQNHATAILALEGVPDSVSTISVSVLHLEQNTIVASATIAAPKTSFTLGVPAEVPLEFRVIARTKNPGPAILGAMPGYYGSTLRTIALDRDQERVALTLHPAGVLTAQIKVDPGLLSGEETIGVSIDAETPGVRPVPFVLAPFDPERPRKQRTLVLRTGRYHASTFRDEETVPQLRGGRGLFVARELESIAVLHAVAPTEAPRPGAPARIALSFKDVEGGTIDTPASGTRALEIEVRALDTAGMEQTASEVSLSFVFDAFPASILAGRIADADQVNLPAVFEGTAVTGSGRLRVRAIAELRDGRKIEGALAVNVLAPGVVPSSPEALVLAIEDTDQITEGTHYAIDIVDARGLFVPMPGFIDLSASDPWVFFAEGPGTAIAPADRGHVRRSIARPSGPRGLPVVVRAALTSTAAPLVLTSSVVLPLLELEP